MLLFDLGGNLLVVSLLLLPGWLGFGLKLKRLYASSWKEKHIDGLIIIDQ